MTAKRFRVQRNGKLEPSTYESLDEGVWRFPEAATAALGLSSEPLHIDLSVRAPNLPAPGTDGRPLGHEFAHMRVYEAGMVEAGRAAAANSSSQTIFGIAPRIQRQPAVPTGAKGAGKGRTHFEAVVHQTYAIEATALDDAAAEIQQRTEAGSTEWNPKLKVVVDENGTVTSATVDVSITMTMPHWPGAAKLNKAARAEWNRFTGALKKHEDGHVTLVREHLKGLGESLVGMSQDDADAAFQAALVDLQTASDAYDDGNDHGRSDGTIIDTSAGSPTTP